MGASPSKSPLEENQENRSNSLPPDRSRLITITKNQQPAERSATAGVRQLIGYSDVQTPVLDHSQVNVKISNQLKDLCPPSRKAFEQKKRYCNGDQQIMVQLHHSTNESSRGRQREIPQCQIKQLTEGVYSQLSSTKANSKNIEITESAWKDMSHTKNKQLSLNHNQQQSLHQQQQQQQQQLYNQKQQQQLLQQQQQQQQQYQQQKQKQQQQQQQQYSQQKQKQQLLLLQQQQQQQPQYLQQENYIQNKDILIPTSNRNQEVKQQISCQTTILVPQSVRNQSESQRNQTLSANTHVNVKQTPHLVQQQINQPIGIIPISLNQRIQSNSYKDRTEKQGINKGYNTPSHAFQSIFSEKDQSFAYSNQNQSILEFQAQNNLHSASLRMHEHQSIQSQDLQKNEIITKHKASSTTPSSCSTKQFIPEIFRNEQKLNSQISLKQNSQQQKEISPLNLQAQNVTPKQLVYILKDQIKQPKSSTYSIKCRVQNIKNLDQGNQNKNLLMNNENESIENMKENSIQNGTNNSKLISIDKKEASQISCQSKQEDDNKSKKQNDQNILCERFDHQSVMNRKDKAALSNLQNHAFDDPLSQSQSSKQYSEQSSCSIDINLKIDEQKSDNEKSQKSSQASVQEHQNIERQNQVNPPEFQAEQQKQEEQQQILEDEMKSDRSIENECQEDNEQQFSSTLDLRSQIQNQEDFDDQEDNNNLNKDEAEEQEDKQEPQEQEEKVENMEQTAPSYFQEQDIPKKLEDKEEVQENEEEDVDINQKVPQLDQIEVFLNFGTSDASVTSCCSYREQKNKFITQESMRGSNVLKEGGGKQINCSENESEKSEKPKQLEQYLPPQSSSSSQTSNVKLAQNQDRSICPEQKNSKILKENINTNKIVNNNENHINMKRQQLILNKKLLDQKRNKNIDKCRIQTELALLEDQEDQSPQTLHSRSAVEDQEDDDYLLQLRQSPKEFCRDTPIPLTQRRFLTENNEEDDIKIIEISNQLNTHSSFSYQSTQQLQQQQQSQSQSQQQQQQQYSNRQKGLDLNSSKENNQLYPQQLFTSINSYKLPNSPLLHAVEGHFRPLSRQLNDFPEDTLFKYDKVTGTLIPIINHETLNKDTQEATDYSSKSDANRKIISTSFNKQPNFSQSTIHPPLYSTQRVSGQSGLNSNSNLSNLNMSLNMNNNHFKITDESFSSLKQNILKDFNNSKQTYHQEAFDNRRRQSRTSSLQPSEGSGYTTATSKRPSFSLYQKELKIDKNISQNNSLNSTVGTNLNLSNKQSSGNKYLFTEPRHQLYSEVLKNYSKLLGKKSAEQSKSKLNTNRNVQNRM